MSQTHFKYDKKEKKWHKTSKEKVDEEQVLIKHTSSMTRRRRSDTKRLKKKLMKSMSLCQKDQT